MTPEQFEALKAWIFAASGTWDGGKFITRQSHYEAEQRARELLVEEPDQ